MGLNTGIRFCCAFTKPGQVLSVFLSVMEAAVLEEDEFSRRGDKFIFFFEEVMVWITKSNDLGEKHHVKGRHRTPGRASEINGQRNDDTGRASG
jgi:hypothetical protein